MSVKRGTREEAFSGEGAKLFGGRWNSAGLRMVYTSSSLSLSALETLVHADKNSFKRDYIAFHITIPSALIDTLADAELPKNWRQRVVSEDARAVGDAWLANRNNPVLSVPSVIVPLERNYLLNPLHEEFGRLKLSEATEFRFDDRL